MSFNDRAGEAAEIIRHGGEIDSPVVREALIELFECVRDGDTGVYFDVVNAVQGVLHDPRNAELRAKTADGQWYG